MKPSLPVIWSMCTVVIGCCLLLSNFYCKWPSSMVAKTLFTHIDPDATQRTFNSRRRKVSLFNLTSPLFQVFNNEANDIPVIKKYFEMLKLRNKIVTHLPKEYSIAGRAICRYGDDNSEIKLLIIIPSVVEDASLRTVIRETWASEIYNAEYFNSYFYTNGANTFQRRESVRLVFFFGVVGLSSEVRLILEEESNMFGDIVTINLMESYKNLSLKIASSLQWSATMCGQVKYVAKVDVDTMVNVPLMLELLHQVTLADEDAAMVIGFRHVTPRPWVSRRGKWAVPRAVYPLKHFPPYVYGHSYVLTGNALHRIVSSFPYFPLVPNEDAFITGVMPLVANVTTVHTATFTHLFRKQTCQDVQYGRFVSSGHTKTNLRRIWSQLSNPNCSLDFIS